MGEMRGRLESPDGLSRSRSLSPILGTEPLPLDDQSSCHYCHRGFRKPRVLDCLHSMCEDCIIAQLDGKRDQTPIDKKDLFDFELEAPKVSERPTPPGVIKCPVCAQESHVGNDVRFVHQLLLDFVRISESKESPREDRCGTCKSDSAAVAVCKDCQSALCQQCFAAHGVMRLFEGHTVTTYEEMEKNGQVVADLRPVMCHIHAQPSKFLCANCETVGCKICLEIEHKNHKVIGVDEKVSVAIRQDISNMVDRMETKWRSVLNEWSSVPDRHATLHEQYEMAKLGVENAFEDMARIVEEQKQKKLQEVEEARLKQEMNIEGMYKKMRSNESRVTDAISFTRRLLEKANNYELVASRQRVVHQFNGLFHTMPAPGAQFELQYQPIAKKQMDAQIASICGNVVGRMSTTAVKDGHTNGTNGKVEEPVRPPMAPIGTERKKNQHHAVNGSNGTNSRQSNEDFGGWPPSSNPPDLVPSPPLLSSSLIPPFTPQPPVSQPNQLPTSLLPPLTPADLAKFHQDFANLGSAIGGTSTASSAEQLTMQHEYIKSLVAQAPGLYPPQQPPQPQTPLQWPKTAKPPNSTPNHNQFMALVNSIMKQPGAPNDSVAAFNMQATLLNNANIAAAAAQNQLLFQARNAELLNQMKAFSIGAPAAPTLNLAQGLPDAALAPQLGQPRASDLKVHSVFGTSNQGSSIRELHCPSGFCLSEQDDILIADTNNHRVIVCGPPHPWKIGRPGTDDGQLCFPRKVVALRGEKTRYVVLDKGGDGKTRAQIFEQKGEFVKRIQMMSLLPRGGVEVSAATATPRGDLLLVDTSGFVYCIEVDTPRVVFWFDATGRIGEASDVAMTDKAVYITDFKNHCIQVFSLDGKFLQKMGEPSQTPYPIGIDIHANGNIMVADTHGNHLHVVVFSADGHHLHSFTHNEFRLSRCVGLRIAKSGHIVTLCKHNHTLFVFKPLLTIQ